MDRETDRRLAAEALDRISRQAIPQADATRVVDGARYTCSDEFKAERAVLFRRQPLPLALGCEVAQPGDYVALEVAGVPVLLVRDDEGKVQGLLNTCRHRGARLLNGDGKVGRAFACPYHGWSYDRCGVLRGLPGREHFPDVDVGSTGLVRFPTRERSGLVWTVLDPDAAPPEPELHALGPELASFGLEDYRYRCSHTWTKRMNWKLGVDTFLELHHVHVLHRRTIAKAILKTVFLYEPFGRHARLVAPRKTLEEQRDRRSETWRIEPHATIIYRLFPNAVLVSQGPHVEFFRFFPDPERPDTSVCRLTFASPSEDETDRDWDEALRMALGVLDQEDFLMMESVQANLASGIQKDVLFGRNEIGLQNFHQIRDVALAG